MTELAIGNRKLIQRRVRRNRSHSSSFHRDRGPTVLERDISLMVSFITNLHLASPSLQGANSAHPLGDQFLLLMKGHPGTGKSTLAKEIARQLQVPIIGARRGCPTSPYAAHCMCFPVNREHRDCIDACRQGRCEGPADRIPYRESSRSRPQQAQVPSITWPGAVRPVLKYHAVQQGDRRVAGMCESPHAALPRAQVQVWNLMWTPPPQL